MVKAANFRNRHDVAFAGRHDPSRNRRVLVERQVSPGLVVVRLVERHESPDACLVEPDHVIETVATRRSYKALDEWILPRCVRSRDHVLNSHRLRGGLEGIECMVAIMNQIPRRLVPGKRFAELLSHPRRRWMRRDRHVPDAAPIVGEQHQHEYEAERHCWDDEEISRDDLSDVVAQERAPRL